VEWSIILSMNLRKEGVDLIHVAQHKKRLEALRLCFPKGRDKMLLIQGEGFKNYEAMW